MRKITIYQKGSSNVEILDDSETNIDEYCHELSRLFQMANVSILKTSHSTFIGRPSQLTGIVVEDDQSEQQLEISPEPEDTESPVEEPAEEIQEDIITDME
jgi:hypothetical protein